MKKISKKDLSLQRETISSLSNESLAGDGAYTISCNVSLCRDCPTATFATVCTPCNTGVNCQETGTEATCQATESHGPVCCAPDPPIPFTQGPTSCLETGGNCETQNDCISAPNCVVSVDICAQTIEDGCETQNCAMSVDICAQTIGTACATRNGCETNADCEAVTISVANKCLTKPCP